MSGKAKPPPKAKPTAKKMNKPPVEKTKTTKVKPKTTAKEDIVEDPSTTSSSDQSPTPQRAGNRFALLDDGGNGDVSSQEETSEKETGNDSEQVTVNTVNNAKKKMKRKKKASHSFAASHDKNIAPVPKDWKDMTEEQLLDSLAALNVHRTEAGDEEKKDYSSATFSVINPKLLNYRYEFQKTVGKSGMSALLPDTGLPAKTSRGLSKGIQHLFVTPQPNVQDPKIFMDRCTRLRCF